MTSNSALARWAPQAQHLIVSTVNTLFQTDPFAALAKARANKLVAFCMVLVDALEDGPTEIPPEAGIEALLAGQPFVAQLDQVQIIPVVAPESLHVSQTAQMRWLMIALARSGLVSFVGQPGLRFMPGRDPVPVQNRVIELRAMRLAAEETLH